MLILLVVLFLMFFLTFFRMGPQRRFLKYERMIHPYSGLDPENWKRFLTNLRSFEKLADTDIDRALVHLYGAVENIRDLGLGVRRCDDDAIQTELQRIGNSLGQEGELIINQIANGKGLQFFPKYLNESFDDYPEDGYFIPSTVRSHGQ